MDDVYMERMVVERHDRKRKVWLKAAIAYQQTGLSALDTAASTVAFADEILENYVDRFEDEYEGEDEGEDEE